MTETRAMTLTVATRNVSADGTVVCPGEKGGPWELDGEQVRAMLHAFAGLTAVELVEAEARIFVEGPQGKVAVQNVGGRLFVAAVPEAVNTASEQTPEQTLEWVTHGSEAAEAMRDRESRMAAESAAEMLMVSSPRSSTWKRVANSGSLLAALLMIAAGVAFFTFRPETPQDVEMVNDATRIAELNAKLDGRYGVPGATMLVLAGGQLAGVQTISGGAGEEPRFKFSYRYGQRGAQVVLVLSNGALLELQPEGGLKFLESVYPRLAK